MTYARFHWIFNVPLLVILAWVGWGSGFSKGSACAMGLVLLAAVIFTTPWDNLAVRRGIWGFPRDKYTVRLLWLPIEEYVFFVLQTLAVMLGVRALFQLEPGWHQLVSTRLTVETGIALAVAILVWIAVGFALRRGRGSRFNYALHLAWFLPVISCQWVIAPQLLFSHAGLLLLVTAAFGAYYTAADFLAVRAGLWFFDEKQITGFKLAGCLPWEEAAFFLLTSLLVAQSYLLLLPSAER